MKYNFCKNCGSPVQPGMANCQRCGAPVDQVQPVDEDKPMAQPPGMLRQYYDSNNANNNQPMNNQNPPMRPQPMDNQNPPMRPQQPMMNNQPMNNIQQPMQPQQPMMNNQPMNPGMGQPMNGQPMPQQNNDDNGSIVWGIIGFIFTLIGIILYFVWKDSKPKNAKMALKGALAGLIVGFVLGFVLGLLGVNLNI